MSDDGKKISLPIVGDEEGAEGSSEPDNVLEAIDQEVNSNEVVLYMKGSPQNPMCGFSARAAGVLNAYGVTFHAVDVLTEADKREGIKEYADWPTIPQLYVGGEMIGGSDIIMKMHESGELAELFDKEGIEAKSP